MTWSYVFCDTITGDKVFESTDLVLVEPSSGPWSKRLNVGGNGHNVFELGDFVSSARRNEWRNATIPWARTLVVCWDAVPRYAGVIAGRPYDPFTRKLTIRHVDLRTLFLARYPFGEDSYWENESLGIPGKLVIENKSIAAAVATVLHAATTGPAGGADYSLPITLPSMSTSGTFDAVYENYNFRKVAHVLDELQSMDGGPDIEFRERWLAGKLDWETRVGTLTGGSFTFDLDAEDGKVTAFNTGEDAMKQVTGVFGVGQGYGKTMVVGGTPGVTVADIPARDDHVAWKMVKTNEHASKMAKERLRVFKSPTVQPRIKVLATEVSPTSLVLGSSVTVQKVDDPFMLDAPKTYRLIGLSGDTGLEIELLIEEEAA